jgi:hypothetical protein
MQTFVRIAIGSAFCVLSTMLAVGCGGATDAPSAPEEEEQAVEGATTVSINAYCTVDAVRPNIFFPGQLVGGGDTACAYPYNNNVTETLQVCMQQLVAGGWQTMDWTCRTKSSSHEQTLATGAVAYYTAGRWYRTWSWGYAMGRGVSVFGPGCKGDGGSHCYPG